MPRKPTFQHRLRTVRRILGKTQNEFAKLVDVSASAIKRIENGKLILSRELAERIALRTNINGAWLFYGKGQSPLREPFSDTKPIDYLGNAYTKETFLEGSMWPTNAGEITDKVRAAIDHACEKCAKVLRAASRKRRFDSVWFMTDGLFNDAWRTFKLGTVYEEDHGAFENCTVPDSVACLGPDSAEMKAYLAHADRVSVLRRTLAPNLLTDISRAVKERDRAALSNFRSQIERALTVLDEVKPLQRRPLGSLSRRTV